MTPPITAYDEERARDIRDLLDPAARHEGTFRELVEFVARIRGYERTATVVYLRWKRDKTDDACASEALEDAAIDFEAGIDLIEARKGGG